MSSRVSSLNECSGADGIGLLEDESDEETMVMFVSSKIPCISSSTSN